MLTRRLSQEWCGVPIASPYRPPPGDGQLGFWRRLSTRAAVFSSPLRPEEALDVIDGWLAQPCASVVHPTGRHPAILRGLLTPLGTGGNLTSDAHLAIEHGGVLCSCDADYSRFPGLAWQDPLRE